MDSIGTHLRSRWIFSIWIDCPILYYAIFFFIGLSTFLSFHWIYILILVLCLVTSQNRIYGICCLSFAFLWALSYDLPLLSKDGIEGEGKMKIYSITYQQSPFQKSISLKGVLKQFKTNLKTWNNIPCQIYLSEKQFTSPMSGEILVKGKLSSKSHPYYVLKCHRYEVTKHKPCFAFQCFYWKNKFYCFLKKYLPENQAFSFLFSLLTGEMDNRLIHLEFNRLGITHLATISGLQFAILAFFIERILCFIYPLNITYGILIAILSGYTWVLGNTPSIHRAWITTVLYKVGLLKGYPTNSLNTLGFSLFWILLMNPLAIFQLGFQFSFLCVYAILVIYPFFNSFLLSLFPFRTKEQIKNFSRIDRIGYRLSCFCRQTVALNGAIHIATLPILLYHFHKFPCLSLLYNLFLPFLTAWIYLALISALFLLIFFPFLSELFFKWVQFLTKILLTITSYPPALYDFQWRVPHFSFLETILVLILVLGIPLFYRANQRMHFNS